MDSLSALFDSLSQLNFNSNISECVSLFIYQSDSFFFTFSRLVYSVRHKSSLCCWLSNARDVFSFIYAYSRFFNIYSIYFSRTATTTTEPDLFYFLTFMYIVFKHQWEILNFGSQNVLKKTKIDMRIDIDLRVNRPLAIDFL